MAGKEAPPPFKMLLILVLGLLKLCSLAQASVIGVDMGGEFMKVSVVQPGAPLEIVINFVSKRKTETIVTFYKGDRYYASDALGYVSKVPGSAFSKVTTTLGRDISNPLVVRMGNEYQLQTVPEFNETRKGIIYRMKSNGPSGAEETYTPEEITAMILSYARDITKAFGGSVVKDGVLTVPSYWTYMERQAYIDAATLAGLKVLSLIEENTAAALQWGIDRVYENETTVLFYNMGATATQVTIATYSSYGTSKKDAKPIGQFVIRGKGWDSNLGGHTVDLIIADFLASEFNKKWSPNGSKDVRKVPRAMAKIRAQAGKVKEVLSANQEIPVWIAALHDDMDFNTHLSRSHMENLCKDFFHKCTKPIEDALKYAGMTVDDIHLIEMIGGGVRVPKVASTLADFFGVGKEMGIHMNGDEAMAVGAAFRAANLSTAFKVRKVGLGDINAFAVRLTLQDLPKQASSGDFLGMLNKLWGSKKTGDKNEEGASWSRSSLLFDYYCKTDLKKKISFTHTEDIQVTLSYEEFGEDNPQLPEGTSPLIVNYNVTGIAQFSKDLEVKKLGPPKVVLHFHLDASGIPQLSRAEATFEEEIVVLQTEADKKDQAAAASEGGELKSESETTEDESPSDEDATVERRTTDEASDEATDDEQSNEAGEANSESTAEEVPSDSEGGDSAKAAEADSSAEGAEKTPKNSKKSKKGKKDVPGKQSKVHRKSLSVIVSNHFFTLRPYSETEIQDSKNKLAELQRLDDVRHRKAEAKNSLESYILSLRNNFLDDDDLSLVSTEEAREEILTTASQLEDWLYDEGFDLEANVYDQKRMDLKEKADIIFFRAKEMKQRPHVVSMARKIISESRELLKKWEEEKPQVTEEERNEVYEKLQKFEEWLDEKSEAQKGIAPHEDAVFTSAQVDSKLKVATGLITKLSRKPKPVPKKVVANETAVDAKTGKTNETSTEQESKEDEGIKLPDDLKEETKEEL